MKQSVDVKEMHRYCVVCGKEFGPFLKAHCTDSSLVAVKRDKEEALFFTLDGKALNEDDLSRMKEAETARMATSEQKRKEEAKRRAGRMRPLRPTHPRPESESLPVRVWTSRLIGLVTFFLGFPAGVVLASINWMQMNMKGKALVHLVVGAAGMLAFPLVMVLVPGLTGAIIALFVNLAMVYYLRKQTENDVTRFKATGADVQSAEWSWGCLIGIAVGGLYLALVFGLIFLLSLAGVPIPEYEFLIRVLSSGVNSVLYNEYSQP